MSEAVKKFLIHTGIGLVLSFLLSCLLGVFGAETAVDRLRLLCDGFFVSAAMLLCVGGLRWTSNGGAMDGLGYASKMGIARMRRDFETTKMSFADYQENRRSKAKSPKYLLLAGLVQLVIALVLYAVYSKPL